MPVKSLNSAKSRIGAEFGSALALAFFRDALTAAVDCPAVAAVVVATHDEVVADVARERGCTVVDDSDHPGINAAAAWAAEQSGGPERPVAVIVSDLPCLTGASLAAVLAAAAAYDRCFLSDADGAGTTMWMTSGAAPVDSRFGPSSAQAHLTSGAVDLSSQLDSAGGLARRDVDTADDLQAAIRLGVGRHTQRAVGMTGPVLVTALGRAYDGRLEMADENGCRHSVDASAIASSGLRDVRPGQRLLLDETAPTILRIP